MRASTGNWVSGSDFFNRDKELRVLETRVRDGNHVLLSGQRRMGKTSVTQELGRRLVEQGWEFLFADVEGATCAEDVIAAIAEAARPVRPISSHLWINGVASAVYDKLGVGIPHHVQSFFVRLTDFAVTRGRRRVTVADIDTAYETEMLGPSGQNDLAHYDARLKDGLDEDGYRVAMEILAEAATRDVFTAAARRCLERVYETLVEDVRACVAETLDVLVHDGYLESATDGYRFPSRLLRDWWAARFRNHHVPLERRL